MIIHSKTRLSRPKLVVCLFKPSYKSPQMVFVVPVDQICDICVLGQILGLTPINSIFTVIKIIGFNLRKLAKNSKTSN